MSDVSIYQGHLTAAITAIAASDWATAENEILQARAALAALPDSEVDEDRVEWGRKQLDTLSADLQRQRSAAGGIQRTKIKYIPVSD